MTPIIKPEQHGGTVVGRPYTRGADGIMQKLESTSVFHMPTISVVHTLENMVEDETRAIIGMRAMTTSELRSRLYAFAKSVIANDRRANGG